MKSSILSFECDGADVEKPASYEEIILFTYSAEKNVKWREDSSQYYLQPKKN